MTAESSYELITKCAVPDRVIPGDDNTTRCPGITLLSAHLIYTSTATCVKNLKTLRLHILYPDQKQANLATALAQLQGHTDDMVMVVTTQSKALHLIGLAGQSQLADFAEALKECVEDKVSYVFVASGSSASVHPPQYTPWAQRMRPPVERVPPTPSPLGRRSPWSCEHTFTPISTAAHRAEVTSPT